MLTIGLVMQREYYKWEQGKWGLIWRQTQTVHWWTVGNADNVWPRDNLSYQLAKTTFQVGSQGVIPVSLDAMLNTTTCSDFCLVCTYLQSHLIVLYLLIIYSFGVKLAKTFSHLGSQRLIPKDLDTMAHTSTCGIIAKIAFHLWCQELVPTALDTMIHNTTTCNLLHSSSMSSYFWYLPALLFICSWLSSPTVYQDHL